MHYDKDKIKSQLTLEQVAEVIMDLGAAYPIMKDGMLLAETICHNLPGEGSVKLYYYDNTKLFKCYTGCHEYFDIFQLVQKAKDVQYDEEWSLPKAVHYVAQKLGIAGEMLGFEDEANEDWKLFHHYTSLMEKAEKGERVNVDLKVYDSGILDRLDFFPIASWLKEGITIETLVRFGIKYYSKDHKIVIPHYDDLWKLIGIRGRTLIKQEAEWFGKYMPIKINGIMYNHPLSFVLYGLNWNKENIKKVKKVVIFEGEKSVMLYDSYYGSENNISVASCGSSISAYQFQLLRDLGVDEIAIAYDRQFKEIGDEEFKTHVKTLKQLAAKFRNYVTVSILFDREGKLGYKQSPIDCGKETFEYLFQNRIII